MIVDEASVFVFCLFVYFLQALQVFQVKQIADRQTSLEFVHNRVPNPKASYLMIPGESVGYIILMVL